MDFFDLVGYAAALCSSCAFLPQLVQTWRTKSAEDLSVGLFALTLGGVLCWLTYGLHTGDRPIIVCNVVALVLVGANFALLLRYRRRPAVA